MALRNRCYNQNTESYVHYGGRGITVCPRWLRSFKHFMQDMGPRPAGTSIDRIDVNGNYEPGNCRWATAQVQARNKRPIARIVSVALVLLLAARPALAQSHTPELAIIAGESLDLASTLQALRVPGNREANPLVAQMGTPGLIAAKAGITTVLVILVNRMSHQGHPKAARIIGYSIGAALSGVAYHNWHVQ